MTTYLIKIENNKTHHYKAAVEGNGVEIVTGVFYNWLAKSWQGCGDNTSAKKKQKELVMEKLKEGFQITEYHKTLENSHDVYDKAKWHYSGEFPDNLDIYQAYVHTGMFLGCLIDNNLVSDQFREDFEEEIEKFKERKLTGVQIFERCCDGVLSLEELNEQGNRFALQYFNFESGQYLIDYEKCLAGDLNSIYQVKDTWENYIKLKNIIDQRLDEWLNKNK